VKQATILVADDSRTALLQLSRILGPLGHRLVTVTDGQSALTLLSDPALRPDLVILDVVMPAPNGFELCRQIKANPLTAPIPVFLVTSMNRETDRFWGMKQGADEYFTKPIDAELLVTRVRDRLAQAEAAG
jgi:twitching motility two-component system response regulator PilH